jgi:hypothetical protein
MLGSEVTTGGTRDHGAGRLGLRARSFENLGLERLILHRFIENALTRFFEDALTVRIQVAADLLIASGC